jgi:hypothetical protein
MRNATELGLLSAIECRARPYSYLSICAVLPSGLPGGARSAKASGAASQVLSDYAIDAESNCNTRDHRQAVLCEQLF